MPHHDPRPHSKQPVTIARLFRLMLKRSIEIKTLQLDKRFALRVRYEVEICLRYFRRYMQLQREGLENQRCVIMMTVWSAGTCRGARAEVVFLTDCDDDDDERLAGYSSGS